MLLFYLHILLVCCLSLSGVVILLNHNESSNTYLPASVSTFQIAVFVLGNLF